MWNWLKKEPTPTPAEAAAARVGKMVAWWLLGFVEHADQFSCNPRVLAAAHENLEQGKSESVSVAIIAAASVGDLILTHPEVVRDAVMTYFYLPEVDARFRNMNLAEVAMLVDLAPNGALLKPRDFSGLWEAIYSRSLATELDPPARMLFEAVQHLWVRSQLATRTPLQDEELNSSVKRIQLECVYSLRGCDSQARERMIFAKGLPADTDLSEFELIWRRERERRSKQAGVIPAEPNQ